MKDISNEGLLNNHFNNKKNNMISFNSISEKQEESSDSSMKNSKIMKKRETIKNNKNFIKDENTKDEINISNISLKNRLSKNIIAQKKRKTFMIINKNNNEKEKIKENKREEKNKKRSQILSSKRISLQQDNSHFFSNQLKLNEGFNVKRISSKNICHNQITNITNMNQTLLKERSNFNTSLTNNKTSMLSAFQKKNSLIEKSYDYLDNKYFSNKKIKNTVLHKGKLNLKDQKNVNSTNLFEKLRESYLFEKSENLLFKIKICYVFLGFFSFMSILLEILDVLIFNKKTKVFFEENYILYIKNDTDIKNYYFIEKREISKAENKIRVTNLIFSILSFFLHLIIHFIKNHFNKESNKKNKRNNYYYNYNRKRKSSKYRFKQDKNNMNNNENHIKFIMNEDFGSKNFVSREEIIKLVINCIISLVFYPPGINKIFIGIRRDIKYMYSLNSIFLLITFFKIANIYFTVYYLSPFNNLLYKIICSSNMVKMDIHFMFRFLLKLYPLTFMLIHFLIIGLILCILLYCIEFSFLNINNVYNNKGKNDINDFYSVIFLFFTYITKTIHGNIKPETILGSFIFIIGGSLGLLIIFYLIYNLNLLVEFKPDEQQAYSKLVKLLNPINNEHKASNFIKIFILLKKNYEDNQNIEEQYRIKKDNHIKNIIQKNFFGLRKSNFNFATNESNNSLTNVIDNYEYKEKKKFLKYISSQFILKIKLINEFKNFKNNLLIARNNSLSFNDVLKTLGEKMNGNITQLNNKLEVLIQNDQKYKNFMKFQENSIKRLKKIKGYQEYIINYLIDKNNIINVDYLKKNRENQNKLKNMGKLGAGLGVLRRMRSSVNGNFFAFKKKRSRKGSLEEPTKKAKIKEHQKEFFDNVKNIGVKRLRSSIVGNKSSFYKDNNQNNEMKSKTNPFRKLNKNKKKLKFKSFDENILKVSKKRKKNNKIENVQNIRQKSSSLPVKKKEIIDKWKNKIEIKNIL